MKAGAGAYYWQHSDKRRTKEASGDASVLVQNFVNMRCHRALLIGIMCARSRARPNFRSL